MEQAISVEVISFCGADGTIRPLRFRFTDENQHWQTVQIGQILSVKQVLYVGKEAFCYQCRGILGECMQEFVLRYCIRGHQWSLLGMTPAPVAPKADFRKR